MHYNKTKTSSPTQCVASPEATEYHTELGHPGGQLNTMEHNKHPAKG